MFDHLSVGVRDLSAARAFYDAFLAPLGHAPAVSSETELAYGPAGAAAQFYLYPVDGGQVAGLGAHVAFAADSRAAVDAAYAAALAGGAVSVRAAWRWRWRSGTAGRKRCGSRSSVRLPGG